MMSIAMWIDMLNYGCPKNVPKAIRLGGVG